MLPRRTLKRDVVGLAKSSEVRVQVLQQVRSGGGGQMVQRAVVYGDGVDQMAHVGRAQVVTLLKFEGLREVGSGVVLRCSGSLEVVHEGVPVSDLPAGEVSAQRSVRSDNPDHLINSAVLAHIRSGN